MANNATLTISGNVVAAPRVTGDIHRPDRVEFRVVSNRRRFNPDTGEWVDAGEYGMNVVCWRKLARGVASSIHRGDPVLVIGRLADREYTGKDGERRWRTEVTAEFVGHDLAQGAASFIRFTKMTPPGGETSDARADGPDATDVGVPGPGGASAAFEQAPPADAFESAPVDVFDATTEELAAV